MCLKLFFGGLPYETTEEQLTELFVAQGQLKEVHIAKDKETGNSKGFAFVTYKSYKEGEAAIEALKGTKIDGRKLTIQESKPKGGRDRGGRGGGRRQNDRGRGRRDRR